MPCRYVGFCDVNRPVGELKHIHAVLRSRAVNDALVTSQVQLELDFDSVLNLYRASCVDCACTVLLFFSELFRCATNN